jgi:hypothetical protein
VFWEVKVSIVERRDVKRDDEEEEEEGKDSKERDESSSGVMSIKGELLMIGMLLREGIVFTLLLLMLLLLVFLFTLLLSLL